MFPLVWLNVKIRGRSKRITHTKMEYIVLTQNELPQLFKEELMNKRTRRSGDENYIEKTRKLAGRTRLQ